MAIQYGPKLLKPETRLTDLKVYQSLSLTESSVWIILAHTLFTLIITAWLVFDIPGRFRGSYKSSATHIKRALNMHTPLPTLTRRGSVILFQKSEKQPPFSAQSYPFATNILFPCALPWLFFFIQEDYDFFAIIMLLQTILELNNFCAFSSNTHRHTLNTVYYMRVSPTSPPFPTV